MTGFPALKIQPDSFACVVFDNNGMERPGQIDLAGGQHAVATIYDWPYQHETTAAEKDLVIMYPQRQHFDLLRCRLRIGHDVLLHDVTVTLHPDEARMVCELAVVGRHLDDQLEATYSEVCFQVTEAHRVFGTHPVDAHSLIMSNQTVSEAPAAPEAGNSISLDVFMPETNALAPEVVAEQVGSPDSNDTPESATVIRHWVDFDESASREYAGNPEIRCAFWKSQSVADNYHFHVDSAPVFEFKTETPLTATQWVTQYLVPMRELVTLATLEPQTIAWALSYSENPEAEQLRALMQNSGGSADAPIPQLKHQFFGRDATQEPFTVRREPDTDGASLFTFVDLPYGPAELLRRWDETRSNHAGFTKPLILGLTDRMSVRSRFLFLVQSLEGLHVEQYGEGSRSPEEYKEKRSGVLKKIKESKVLTAKEFKWLDHRLDSRGSYSLEERLRRLCDDVREELSGFASFDELPQEVSQIRNKLSHGARDYADEELWRHCRTMSVLATAHILRFLELPLDRLGRIFR